MHVATEKPGRIPAEGHGVVAELEKSLRGEHRRLSRELLSLQLPLGGPRRMGGHHLLDRVRGVRRRLRLVSQLIAELPLVGPDSLRPDRAGFGALVFTQDLDTGRERAHRLVCGEPDGLDASQVSLASPLGRALAHARAGDVVAVDAPPETRRLRVLALTTLPRALGMTGAGAPAPAAGPSSR